MTEPDVTRRFDEQEFALILRKAAELQERDAARPVGTGLTLGEIETIAAEAGIRADYVRRALGAVERPDATIWRRLAGPSTRIREQHVIPGEVGSGALAAVIDNLQSALGTPGVARDVLGGVEWTGRDSFGKVHMIARPIAGDTRVQLVADRSETAAVLATLLPITGMIAGGILGSTVDVVPAAAMAGAGIAGGLAAARLLWSRIAMRWQARLQRLTGDVVATAREAAHPGEATSRLEAAPGPEAAPDRSV